jgi:hypothetical protein
VAVGPRHQGQGKLKGQAPKLSAPRPAQPVKLHAAGERTSSRISSLAILDQRVALFR